MIIRRQGERLRTPKDWREILLRRSEVEVDTDNRLDAGLSRAQILAAQGRRLNNELGGVKQSGGLLSRSHAEVLISELCGRATPRSAI